MKRIFFLIVVVIFSVMAIYGAFRIYNVLSGSDSDSGSAAKSSAVEKSGTSEKRAAWALLKKNIENELKGFKGTAGIVIKDLDLNWEIVSNEDAPIPSASMVKIPIMMAYFYASNDGVVDLKSKISLANREKSPGSGLLKNVAAGKQFSLEELIYLMISSSDNTAANILIDRLGLDAINRYFLRMGLKSTNLVRKMMDFSQRKAGVENYTTAREMADLLEKMYRDRFLSPAISKNCLQILAGQKVNDRIPKKLPGGTMVAHKTGLEDGLCHDAGIVYTDKGNFLICVLTKHKYKSAREAKSLIATISLLAYMYHNGG